MKTATILALASSATAQYFGVMVSRSASPIHLQQVEANGQRLCKKPIQSFKPSSATN